MATETDAQRDARLRGRLMKDLFQAVKQDPANGNLGEPYGSIFDSDKGVIEEYEPRSRPKTAQY